jgi:hypothetical protein
MSNVLMTGKRNTDRTLVQEAYVNSSGQQLMTLNGDLGSSLNRVAGGAITPYVSVTGSVAAKAAPGIFYGIVCLTNGTISLYDNASAASGQVVYPATALTAGQIVTFGGAGIILANGLYASIVGGTYIVLVA